jgi:predicted ABC-type ATPase
MYRLRIFSGPNGSGKSTLYRQLEGQFNLGYYLNPDDLHQTVCKTLMLDFSEFNASAKQSDWAKFWTAHGLSKQAPLLKDSYIENNILVFKDKPKSYESAILAAFLRQCLLQTGATFSFESVFSHPSKLEFMKQAQAAGYKCYLYFACVSSANVSVARVTQREKEGGHGVPEEKIRERYLRTLDNLVGAIKLSYRAYLFDNSQAMKMIAEMTPDRSLELKADRIPSWLQHYVLEKL